MISGPREDKIWEIESLPPRQPTHDAVVGLTVTFGRSSCTRSFSPYALGNAFIDISCTIFLLYVSLWWVDWSVPLHYKPCYGNLIWQQRGTKRRLIVRYTSDKYCVRNENEVLYSYGLVRREAIDSNSFSVRGEQAGRERQGIWQLECQPGAAR